MNNREIRVFLCEGDKGSGTMLQEYPIAKEYEVDPFTGREVGLEAFCQKKYDLCLIDVMTPEMDGFELAKEIRTLEPKTPIIFVTAKDQKKDILVGFKLGADDCITKPLSMREPEARMEAIMRCVVSDGHEH